MAFVYFNPNPYRLSTHDCTVRAVSAGARRDSRGRYMAGGNRGNSGMYGWMPGPYYAGGNYGADNAALAANLEQIASSGNGSEGMATALREAARWLRQS